LRGDRDLKSKKTLNTIKTQAIEIKLANVCTKIYVMPTKLTEIKRCITTKRYQSTMDCMQSCTVKIGLVFTETENMKLRGAF